MSNAERQQKFQLANPGYDRRRKARQRAALKGTMNALKWRAALAAHAAQAEQAHGAEAMPAKPVLMLPAPVVDPMMAQLNALRASMTARREAEPAPLIRQTSHSSPASRAA